MARWFKRGFVVLAVAAACAAIVYAFLPQPVPVDLGRVTRGPLQVTVDEDGKTRIKDRYTVSSPAAGELLRVDLRAGDAVCAGKTLLATLEPSDPSLLNVRQQAEAQARVKAAEASRRRAETQIEQAEAAAEHADADYRRFKELVKKGSITVDQFEQAGVDQRARREDLRAAQFALQVADFEWEQARAALIRSFPRKESSEESWRLDIHSPIDGRVLRVFQESAAVVQPGTQIMELGDPKNLEAVVDVLSSDAVKISPGDEVLLEHWGGQRPLVGRARLVEPSGFTKVSALGVEEQRVNVVIDLTETSDGRATLGDAFRVEARVIIWKADDVLKVPASALFRRGREWAVFAVADGRAVLRSVKIGRQNDLEAQVLDGLREHDVVIVHPSDRVADGAAVSDRAD